MSPASILPTEPAPVIEESAGAGQDRGVEAAVREAVCELQQRVQAEQAKLELLRAQVKAGLDALEGAVGTAPNPGDVNAFISSLADTSVP